jgi:hypothetical protein
MPEQFRGGPLEDGRESQIHSLIVHMNGDGRHSIGWYQQVYSDDAPLGYFDWVPDEPEAVAFTTGEENER